MIQAPDDHREDAVVAWLHITKTVSTAGVGLIY